MKIRSKNPKKEFSRSVLLTALVEDLDFENRNLMMLLQMCNTIIESDLGKDIETDYPELWNEIGQFAVETAKRREQRIYDLS